MELRWNVPESDGGAAIIEYIVERREVGKKSWKQARKKLYIIILSLFPMQSIFSTGWNKFTNFNRN